MKERWKIPDIAYLGFFCGMDEIMVNLETTLTHLYDKIKVMDRLQVVQRRLYK